VVVTNRSLVIRELGIGNAGGAKRVSAT
jgi:hypothetical protein